MKVADAVAFAHRERRDPSRSEARKRDARRLRRSAGDGLGPGAGHAPSFRNAEQRHQPDSMGGTPAYMAPEMATGPVRADRASQRHLPAGRDPVRDRHRPAPHTARHARSACSPRPTTRFSPPSKRASWSTSPIHAMATNPADRYASVQEFQTAIRDYHSHIESIQLAVRAGDDLERSQDERRLPELLPRVFGFQECSRCGLAMLGPARASRPLRWPMPRALQEGRLRARCVAVGSERSSHTAGSRRAGSGAARARGAAEMAHSVQAVAAAMAIVVVAVISVALYVVAQAKNQETIARKQAIADKTLAEKGRKDGRCPRGSAKEQSALEAEKKARDDEMLACTAEAAARKAEQLKPNRRCGPSRPRTRPARGAQGDPRPQGRGVCRLRRAHWHGLVAIKENAFEPPGSC